MTVLLSSRMDTPGLLPTRKHWHSLTHRSRHTHTHPLSDTSRAISNQSRWLLRSSLNGGPDLRYAALFPPSPNFQATRGKGVWEKWREREHAILLFLNKSSTHLILLPNLQSWDRLLWNEKVGWRSERSLLREQPPAFSWGFKWNCQNAVISNSFIYAATA